MQRGTSFRKLPPTIPNLAARPSSFLGISGDISCPDSLTLLGLVKFSEFAYPP